MAAAYGIGAGGLFGPGFDGPDDTIGYGDQLATSSSSNTAYMYVDDYRPAEVRTASLRSAASDAWLIWPPIG